MKKKILLFSIIGTCLLAAIFFKKQYEEAKNIGTPLTKETKRETTNFHSAYHMDKEFYGDLAKMDKSTKPVEQIYGGITSHHFLMAKEIANLIATLKYQKPETLVVVGPNHFNLGKGDILVSKYPYNTPWGMLSPDDKVINKLLDLKVVGEDEDPFSREHSISTLVGFIKYYLPDTKIVPIILKRTVSREKTLKLAEKLNEILPDNSIVLASVDFSHHLNDIAMEFHDQRNVSIVNNFDFNRLYSAEIDSPLSIDTLLTFLKARKAEKMVYTNTNSSEKLENPSLEDGTSYLFSKFFKGSPETQESVSMLSFGDMMFDREIKKTVDEGINPFSQIIGQEGNFFKGVDFISANLEGPITEIKDCSEKAYSFRFDPKVIKLIANSGINIVNLANNHIFDCKRQGTDDTIRYLENSKIDHFGVFGPEKSYILKEVGGKKIAFVGIDTTTQPENLDGYYSLISQLKEQADYVIVNIHWGSEYSQVPSQRQKDIAHSLVDNGADIIIGHHPHVVQPVEIYNKKAIFYSLGNFVFDQSGSEVNKGLGVGTVFSEGKEDFYLFPFNIKNYQPILLPYDEAATFCNGFLKNIQGNKPCRFELSR